MINQAAVLPVNCLTTILPRGTGWGKVGWLDGYDGAAAWIKATIVPRCLT